MQKRKLGRTGLDVSILGVGGHTYPVGEGAQDFCAPEQRAQLIHHLVAAGVDYFDTTCRALKYQAGRLKPTVLWTGS